MSETKQNDCNNSDTKSNYESKAMVLWRFDNPYANYKKDTERIFVFNGYTLQISQNLMNKIDITKNTGNIVWDGAYILSKYIIDHINFYEILNIDSNNEQIKFLELGSGCGLVGLAAWIKGGKIEFTGTKTNIGHTKMNVEKNVKLILEQQNQKLQVENKNIKELRKEDVGVHALDWRELPEPDDTKNIMHINNFGTFDIILASELLYLPELHKDLVKTMKYYCHRNNQNIRNKRNTRVLGIYKERGLSEPSFFEIAKSLGKFNVEWVMLTVIKIIYI
ncbi:hypothetical protein Glove_393g43 [Diversispora epigaea]|uniref:Calmodulin-lysine N-methyltransferase n=1 Tax=Diversispora epigaea TaxID=1348612 RepID=A0A397H649_9GLOM|nr:hypothetical protein Glove_393g43 [Diversispora epigaea]